MIALTTTRTAGHVYASTPHTAQPQARERGGGAPQLVAVDVNVGGLHLVEALHGLAEHDSGARQRAALARRAAREQHGGLAKGGAHAERADGALDIRHDVIDRKRLLLPAELRLALLHASHRALRAAVQQAVAAVQRNAPVG